MDFDYYEYELDSKDALLSNSGNSSKYDWPMFEMVRPLDNIVGLKIVECQIPFSFYTINSENNTFKVMVNSIEYVITIPEGNYSASTLTTTLLGLLTTTEPTFTVTFDSITGKFTFSCVPAFYFTFSATSVYTFLGFNIGQTTTGTILTSTNVAEITGPNYLYINSDSLGSLIQLYLPSGSSIVEGGVGPEIAKVPIETNPNGVIFWQDPVPQHFFNLHNLLQLKSIDLYLTLGTSTSKPLKLNGLGFSVKIGLLIQTNESLISKDQVGSKRSRVY